MACATLRPRGSGGSRKLRTLCFSKVFEGFGKTIDFIFLPKPGTMVFLMVFNGFGVFIFFAHDHWKRSDISKLFSCYMGGGGAAVPGGA